MERPLGRDAGLSLRMTLALAFLGSSTSGSPPGSTVLYRLVPSWWRYWLVLVVALGMALAGHYRSIERLLLGAVRAEIGTTPRGESLHQPLERLAELADVPCPRTLGGLLVGGPFWGTLIWLVVWPLGLPLWAIGLLLTLTVSRYREYAADRGSALLSGELGRGR